MENNFTNFESKFRNFEFKLVPAVRTQSRGRASGGCFFGFKKNLKNMCCEFKVYEGVIFVELLYKEKCFRILPTYINCNQWNNDFEKLEGVITRGKTSNLLVVGDMNARTGRQAGNENEILGIERNSKDIIVNARGLKLIELCDTYGLRIQNGTSLSDTNGEFTFVGGQGSSVIDYSLVGSEWNELIVDLEIHNVPYSDHFPIAVNFKLNTREAQESRIMNTLPKIKWKSKHKSEYQLRLNNALICQRTYDLPQIEEIIKASYYTVNTNTQRNSPAPWYDADCRKYRKLSFGWLRAYRTSNEDYFRHQYLMANKAYKEICKQKRLFSTKLNQDD